ncbi:MAG: transglutaminase-like domain-containing protein [Pirellulaceae bacterium]
MGLLLAEAAAEETLKLGAAALLERGVSEHVALGDDGAIELIAGELIEDDGPAAGYTYGPNVEKLTDGLAIKKDLLVERPAAKGATLLVARGGELKLQLNGRPVTLDEPRMLGHYWQAYTLDPKLLVSGSNEFVISGEGQVWVALDADYAAGSLTRTHHPNRSAKSADGGKTWSDEKLGLKDDLDGEYYVRLFLDHFAPRGGVTTPVVDLGNLAGASIAKSMETPRKIQVSLDAVAEAGARVAVRHRSGSTYVPSAKTWSDWQESSRLEFDLEPTGRYLQVEIQLASDDPLASPRVRGLTLSTTSSDSSENTKPWTAGLRLAAAKNPPLVRSSVPFQYEPFERKELAQLRTEYKLDEIVRGAATELELVSRLAAWSSALWSKGHLGKIYPKWDAHDILAPFGDGAPVGGFCLHHNLVFLQACESFGIPGRVLSIGAGNHVDKIRGGHEIAEVWSNEFEKWIYVDGDAAWYFLDVETQTPLSAWELRQRQLDAWQGDEPKPVKCVKVGESRFEWTDFHNWPPLMELRLVPRSNFLQQKAPLPLNQGMRGWFWTGHYVWSDERKPAREIYWQRVVRRENFEWTLNRPHLTIEPIAAPGQVRVHIDSNTPGLAHYLAAIDDGSPQPVEPVFTWKLRPGGNRLRVVPKNKGGREGIASWIELDYQP